jgi:hypothetical protein
VDATVHPRDIQTPSGFQECLISGITESTEKFMDTRLMQRFATGYLDEGAMHAGDLPEDFLHGQLPPFGKGIRRVAPHAPEVTVREADENTGTS